MQVLITLLILSKLKPAAYECASWILIILLRLHPIKALRRRIGVVDGNHRIGADEIRGKNAPQLRRRQAVCVIHFVDVIGNGRE
jgi:hypothetical protein